MSFAQKQLEKYGWKVGEPLNANGLAKPLPVSVKKNKHGIGAQDQKQDNWWDHLFNKTCMNISVDSNQDEIKIKSFNMEGTQKEKTATVYLEQGEKSWATCISDAELFKACGKRTARKGARGCHSSSSKLKQVKEKIKKSRRV